MAILTKKTFTISEPISDRILKISIVIYNKVFTVIATYTPTNPHNIDGKMQFYEQRSRKKMSVFMWRLEHKIWKIKKNKKMSGTEVSETLKLVSEMKMAMQ